MRRATILNFYEVSNLLRQREDPVSVELFKNDLSDPRVFCFLDDNDSMLFILKPMCHGVYDLHFYTDLSVTLLQIKGFCFSCCKAVKKEDTGFTNAINIVHKNDRHLRLMMHRLFKAKKLSVTESGATVYLTDYKIVEEW